jgi:hypothetical protein
MIPNEIPSSRDPGKYHARLSPQDGEEISASHVLLPKTVLIFFVFHSWGKRYEGSQS